MNAEVISIGDELTSGQRLDTNSQWISQRLGELGIPVVFHTTVADDLAANVRAFREAVERADVIVASGGLGPTADDLTREALAAVSGCPLVLDAEVLTYIRALFARFSREMPERNVAQAMFPEGSRVIPNPGGTAPGIDIEIARQSGPGSARVFALPGVPAELFDMWEQTVAGELMRSGGSNSVIRHRRIKCFGAGESAVEQMLPDLIRRGRTPSVGITVSRATITLRITAAGTNADACYEAMEPTVATIRRCLGDLVFGEEDDELEHVVCRLLAQQSRTLSTAEWGTAGMVAQVLGEVAASDRVLSGGVIVPGAASLASLLGVEPDLVEAYPAAGGGGVEAMATALRSRTGSDLALAIGPLPEGTSPPQEQRAFFAVATPDEVLVRSAPRIGSPALRKVLAAKQALNLVRLTLLRAG